MKYRVHTAFISLVRKHITLQTLPIIIPSSEKIPGVVSFTRPSKYPRLPGPPDTPPGLGYNATCTTNRLATKTFGGPLVLRRIRFVFHAHRVFDPRIPHPLPKR